MANENDWWNGIVDGLGKIACSPFAALSDVAGGIGGGGWDFGKLKSLWASGAQATPTPPGATAAPSGGVTDQQTPGWSQYLASFQSPPVQSPPSASELKQLAAVRSSEISEMVKEERASADLLAARSLRATAFNELALSSSGGLTFGEKQTRVDNASRAITEAIRLEKEAASLRVAYGETTPGH